MGTWLTIKWPQMIRGCPIPANVQIRNGQKIPIVKVQTRFIPIRAYGRITWRDTRFTSTNLCLIKFSLREASNSKRILDPKGSSKQASPSVPAIKTSSQTVEILSREERLISSAINELPPIIYSIFNRMDFLLMGPINFPIFSSRQFFPFKFRAIIQRAIDRQHDDLNFPGHTIFLYKFFNHWILCYNSCSHATTKMRYKLILAINRNSKLVNQKLFFTRYPYATRKLLP